MSYQSRLLGIELLNLNESFHLQQMWNLVVVTTLVMTLQLSESQANRTPSTVYKDKYSNSDQKYSTSKYTAEFAHLASRFINFLGIRGTSERTGIKLKAGKSQFQDQSGQYINERDKDGKGRYINTHAAHQIQAQIDIPPKDKDPEDFVEMKNRLGHTDVLDAVMNGRIGTVIDKIQESILKEGPDGPFQRINFKNGATELNKSLAKEVQQKFVAGIETEIEKSKQSKLCK